MANRNRIVNRQEAASLYQQSLIDGIPISIIHRVSVFDPVTGLNTETDTVYDVRRAITWLIDNMRNAGDFSEFITGDRYIMIHRRFVPDVDWNMKDYFVRLDGVDYKFVNFIHMDGRAGLEILARKSQ